MTCRITRSFLKNHHGLFCDSDLLRELFETVLRRCMAEGLFVGEGFAVDANHRLTKSRHWHTSGQTFQLQ